MISTYLSKFQDEYSVFIKYYLSGLSSSSFQSLYVNRLRHLIYIYTITNIYKYTVYILHKYSDA